MKKIFLVVACITVISGVTHAQEMHAIDSLKKILQGTEKAPYTVLHQLAVLYVDRDNETALQFIEKAGRAALNSGDSLSIVKSMRAKAQILLRLERISELANVLEFVLPISTRNRYTTETVSILNCLGAMNMLTGQFDRALSKFFDCYEMAREQRDSASVVAVLNNIGSSYYKLKDYNKAIMYYKKTFSWRSGFNSSFPTDINVSLCYASLEDFTRAQLYLGRARQACGNECDDHMAIHIAYVAGAISMGMKEYANAEEEFMRSFKLARNASDERMQLDNIYSLVEIYLNRNEIERAVQLLNQAEKVIREGVPFNLEMIKIYSRLSDLAFRAKDFRKVAYYQSMYIKLRDSIHDDTFTTNLMRIEADFLQMRHKEQISDKEAIIKLKEGIIARQTYVNVFAWLLVALAIAFLTLLFLSLRRKRNFNILLQEKVRDRTREFDLVLHRVHTQIKEKDLRMMRFSATLEGYLQRISGLTQIAAMDVDDKNNLPLYLSKIEENCQEASATLHRAKKENNPPLYEVTTHHPEITQ